MKLAVISDIHGNLFALEKVLEDIEHEKCDNIISNWHIFSLFGCCVC